MTDTSFRNGDRVVGESIADLTRTAQDLPTTPTPPTVGQPPVAEGDAIERAAKIIGDNLLTRLTPNEEYRRGKTIAMYLAHHGLLAQARSAPAETPPQTIDMLLNIAGYSRPAPADAGDMVLVSREDVRAVSHYVMYDEGANDAEPAAYRLHTALAAPSGGPDVE